MATTNTSDLPTGLHKARTSRTPNLPLKLKALLSHSRELQLIGEIRPQLCPFPINGFHDLALDQKGVSGEKKPPAAVAWLFDLKARTGSASFQTLSFADM